MVEYLFSKQNVAGSSPVWCSTSYVHIIYVVVEQTLRFAHHFFGQKGEEGVITLLVTKLKCNM